LGRHFEYVITGLAFCIIVFSFLPQAMKLLRQKS
jgi:uncharacterized protein with PQ loop repeat